MGTLSAEGYDVRPADSGDLALEAVTLSPPELILLDMRMPGMSGLEVCRKLKSSAQSRDISVIFLSASLDFEDRLEGLESGAVDFINIPFRREEFPARLRTQRAAIPLHCGHRPGGDLLVRQGRATHLREQMAFAANGRRPPRGLACPNYTSTTSDGQLNA